MWLQKIFSSVLEQFNDKTQKTDEAQESFKGAQKMQETKKSTFHEMAEKFGLKTAAILSEDILLSGNEDLTYEEWRAVWFAFPSEKEICQLAKTKMLETAETFDQLISELSFPGEKKELLYYLVKAYGLANTIEELTMLYTASHFSKASEEYETVRKMILERIRILTKSN